MTSCAVLLGLVALTSSSRTRIEIRGTLTPKDIAEIKRLVASIQLPDDMVRFIPKLAPGWNSKAVFSRFEPLKLLLFRVMGRQLWFIAVSSSITMMRKGGKGGVTRLIS